MPQVAVPIPLMWRQRTGGRAVVMVECGTVAQVIANLAAAVPELKGWLPEPDGHLPDHLSIFVNGQDVRILAGAETPIGPEDQVQILPALSGG